MTAAENEEVIFRCPECDESFVVDVDMKAILIKKGCVYCGSLATNDAFS